MKPTTSSFLLMATLLIVYSCYIEDDYSPLNIEQIFVDKPEKIILVDIIYVLPTTSTNNIYNLNPREYIKKLNGSFFHRYDIGLVYGESRILQNDELFDLKDNRGNESETFYKETQDSYKTDRLNIYVMKRKNTVAIAGIGIDQRVLITDESLYKTTSPHEIGHALNLHHVMIEGNIMSTVRPYLRRSFDESQVNIMKNTIDEINSNIDTN